MLFFYFDFSYYNINNLIALITFFYLLNQNYVFDMYYNNLFYNYWQNTMEELSDKNSRIVTCYLNLNATDISNFRFVKGAALYTANFTPPAAPFLTL